MALFKEELEFNLGSQIILGTPKPVPDDYIQPDPDYILQKNGYVYRIFKKTGQDLYAGQLLGNSQDDDIDELIKQFDCSEKSKIKLLRQYQDLKDKKGFDPYSQSTIFKEPSHKKKPPMDFSEWHSPPKFCGYTK